MGSIIVYIHMHLNMKVIRGTVQSGSFIPQFFTSRLTHQSQLCYIQLTDTAIGKKIKHKRMETVSQQGLNIMIVISTEKRIPATTIVERPHLEPLIKHSDNQNTDKEN